MKSEKKEIEQKERKAALNLTAEAMLLALQHARMIQLWFKYMFAFMHQHFHFCSGWFVVSCCCNVSFVNSMSTRVPSAKFPCLCDGHLALILICPGLWPHVEWCQLKLLLFGTWRQSDHPHGSHFNVRVNRLQHFPQFNGPSNALQLRRLYIESEPLWQRSSLLLETCHHNLVSKHR